MPLRAVAWQVSDDFKPFCEEVVAAAKAAGIRAEVDPGSRSLGKMIKVANAEKIPLLAVVGKDEVAGRSLSLSSRKGGQLGSFSVDAAIAKMATAVETSVEPHEIE